MTIGTNNSSPPADFVPDPAPSLTPAFDVGLVSSTVTTSTPGIIASCFAPVIINPHMTFYYEKVVMAEDLTNSKLYIRGIIWIGRILFSNTTEA